MRLKAFAFAVACHSTFAGTAVATEIEPPFNAPETIGMAFCELAKVEVGKGLLYLFTPSFAQLVDDALTHSDKIGAANPDEKPPLGDGIPFASFPDVSPVCEVGPVTDVGNTRQVEIAHKFPDTPDANWTDKLVLADWQGRLLIDDILYGSDDYKMGLRQLAEEVLKQ